MNIHTFWGDRVSVYAHVLLYILTHLSTLKIQPDCALVTTMGCVDMLAYVMGRLISILTCSLKSVCRSSYMYIHTNEKIRRMTSTSIMLKSSLNFFHCKYNNVIGFGKIRRIAGRVKIVGFFCQKRHLLSLIITYAMYERYP